MFWMATFSIFWNAAPNFIKAKQAHILIRCKHPSSGHRPGPFRYPRVGGSSQPSILPMTDGVFSRMVRPPRKALLLAELEIMSPPRHQTIYSPIVIVRGRAFIRSRQSHHASIFS